MTFGVLALKPPTLKPFISNMLWGAVIQSFVGAHFCSFDGDFWGTFMPRHLRLSVIPHVLCVKWVYGDDRRQKWPLWQDSSVFWGKSRQPKTKHSGANRKEGRFEILICALQFLQEDQIIPVQCHWMHRGKRKSTVTALSSMVLQTLGKRLDFVK